MVGGGLGGTKVMFGNAVIYLKGLHKDAFSDFLKSYLSITT